MKIRIPKGGRGVVVYANCIVNVSNITLSRLDGQQITHQNSNFECLFLLTFIYNLFYFIFIIYFIYFIIIFFFFDYKLFLFL